MVKAAVVVVQVVTEVTVVVEVVVERISVKVVNQERASPFSLGATSA